MLRRLWPNFWNFVLTPLAVLGVFFPYLTVRFLFPKSSFRNSINIENKNKHYKDALWTRNYTKFVKVGRGPRTNCVVEVDDVCLLW